MNKFNILCELQRCKENTQEGWDIWYHGAYLGSIIKVITGKYLIIRGGSEASVGIRMNFMAALGSFVDAAAEVYQADYKEYQESQPVIRSIGANKSQQKSLWERVKGWFK